MVSSAWSCLATRLCCVCHCGGVVFPVIADHTVVQGTHPAPTTTVYGYVLPGLWLVHVESMLCVCADNVNKVFFADLISSPNFANC